MRYYLLVMIAAVCEGARIPRISESYIPGFQGAYHGRGESSYPYGLAGVPFSGDYRTQYGNLDVGNGYFSRQTSVGDHANVADHFAGVPFNTASNHRDFNLQALPRNYERFNHARDYDYQL